MAAGSTTTETMTAQAETEAVASGDLAAIERAIASRRAHLVGTVDEFVATIKPAAIARRATDGARSRAQAAVKTPEGAWRTERVAAVGAAALAAIGAVVWLARR